MKVSGKIPAYGLRALQSLTGPHPAPATGPGQRGGKPPATAGCGDTPAGAGGCSACSGAAAARQLPGLPLRPRPLMAPRLRVALLRPPPRHHARGRAQPRAGSRTDHACALASFGARARAAAGAAARLSGNRPPRRVGRADSGNRAGGGGWGRGARLEPTERCRFRSVELRKRSRGRVRYWGLRVRVESGRGRGEKV